MRVYNIFLCPKCKRFLYRPLPARKHICRAGPNDEEILIDAKNDKSLVDPPPMCEGFILKGRK